PAARRHEDRWPPERLLGDGGDCAYERSVGGSAIGVLALLRAELDVAEAVSVEVCTQEVRDLFRILVGHETEVDLPGRLGRYHRLRSGSVVPGLDAADVAGRLEYRRPLGVVIVAAEGEAFDANDLTGRTSIERHAVQHRAVGVARLAHVVVEAADLNAALFVHERCEGMREPPCRVRIVRRAAGVRVARHRANAEVA